MTKIDGIIRLTSPLFIASPEEARYDFALNKFDYGKKDGGGNGAPCTRVRRERVVLIGKEETDAFGGTSSNEEGKEKTRNFAEIPVIPANGIRGLLRRCVADLVFEAIDKRGLPKLSLDAYHTLTCGAAVGSPDNGKNDSIKPILEVMDHPVLGLFGGTTKMVRGAIRVYNGYPLCPATSDAGMVDTQLFPDKMTSTDRLTQVDMFKRDSDVERDIPESARKGLANPEETIQAWKDFLNGDTPRPDGVTPDKGSPRTWAARELVLPGTPFQVGFEVNTYDQAKIGLTLLGLQKLIQRNALGGRTSSGYGQFCALDFYLSDSVSKSRTRLFKDGSLNMDNADIKSAVLAAQEFLAQMTSKEIEDLCKPVRKEEKKEADGKKKKGAVVHEDTEGGE